MKSIKSTSYSVHFGDKAYQSLNDYLREEFNSKIFVLVDNNTRKHCLPVLRGEIDSQHVFEVLEVDAGEKHKNLETCSSIWEQLSRLGADRKSLIINLGGGVITDMGGFAASCFKRGVRFINIPTTLLSMVDASVGAKTGIDLGSLKNQIGLFSDPEMVLIDPNYLNTVSEREMRSGLAEIIKYGYTFDKTLWEDIRTFESIDLTRILPLIHKSVEIKNRVVLNDLHESGLRKTLNFGHTAGHAIESYFLDSDLKSSLTHGEAIAAGMIIELYYSSKVCGLPIRWAEELKGFVRNFYDAIDIQPEDFDPIMELMTYDKKNVSGIINFVLLESIENCKIDQQLDPELIKEGLVYFTE
jgi:3-dehydroquinate synthase